MANNRCEITVNVKIGIDEETVMRCCQLLSIYLTDNTDKEIATDTYNDAEGIRRQVLIRDTEPEK